MGCQMKRPTLPKKKKENYNNHSENLNYFFHLSANACEFVALMSWWGNIGSEYPSVERRNSQSPFSIYRSISLFFIHYFSTRNLDFDRLRQPYQATEWHNLYYMHRKSKERVSAGNIWRVEDKELCLIWCGPRFPANRHHVVNFQATAEQHLRGSEGT